MLAESPIGLDRVARSGQAGRPAVDSRHHDRDRRRVHLRQTQIVAYANSDPSSWLPRIDALGNRSRPPGVRNPSQRGGLKPIRHGPAHWTRSRCGQPKSLTRSLADCGSPLNDRFTPKALFHQASMRSDRLVHPHGVMSSGILGHRRCRKLCFRFGSRLSIAREPRYLGSQSDRIVALRGTPPSRTRDSAEGATP